ncbi:hypothetical protein GCM10011363_37680 [Marivita lacus]|uniref:Chemotaxis protein n=1 Tax=Marivita lacus TaxID=1323742 RepID=A0ABQ1L1Q7_9RHOB|nr:hypothetical protein [Marivita lacus]GGC17579.1 hypothetical protein GCM10011363_37680 [Marivita lacus]
MEFVADVLLVAGALGAGLYCFVLSRRLTRFTDLENGVGAAVAVLSVQVTDLQTALQNAQKTAIHSSDSLEDLTRRAEDAAKRLELMVASLHDLPPNSPRLDAPPATTGPVFSRHAGGAG